QTIELTLFDTGLDSDEFGPTAFDVTSDITIIGPTSNGITLARSGSSNFRLFHVMSTGNLTLRNITLRNGVAAGGSGWSSQLPDQYGNIYEGGAGGGGAAGMGGAIFNEGSLTIENSTLSSNRAIGGVGGFGGAGGEGNGGGGVGQDGFSGWLPSDIIGNPGQGGGPNGGTGNIDTPTDGGNGGGGGGSGSFSANGGNGGFGGGGGGNRAASGATGLGGFGGGNSDRSAAGGGAGMGGAIFNRGGTVAITNSTLSQNSAQGGSAFGGVAGAGHGLGGALFNLDGTVTLQFSTLSDNDVTTGFGNAPRVDGGAIFNKQLNGAAILTLDNTILANTANDQTDLYNDGGSITGSQSNIIETNAAGANGAAAELLIANNGDPKLGTLADNGGPTYTHALLTGSPALDVTANGSYGCGTTIATDQRGIVRPRGTSCDIGAFELAHFTLTVALAGMGSGGVSLDPPGGTYASGTVVTAMATADTGSTFSGWSGDCTGMGSCVLTVDSDKNITATFALGVQPAAGLAVSKHASVAEAIVDETVITYSYQVTNTGEVSLTIQALDDWLGAIIWTPQAGGAAAPVVSLAPGQVAVATRTYTPQMSDLPAPLANTVLVTGTPAAGNVVTATASTEVDLLVRSQAQTMCYGDDIEAIISVQPAAMDAGPVDLVVISGPAPQGLLLRGVTACAPYTGLRSMVELTNGLVTEGCLDQTACNPVRRLFFGYEGDYTIVTVQEVQTVLDLFLPVVHSTCQYEAPICG
ncbi:MAG: hypothetical protein DCC55_26355, partial [Chloroflexi bacterium]